MRSPLRNKTLATCQRAVYLYDCQKHNNYLKYNNRKNWSNIAQQYFINYCIISDIKMSLLWHWNQKLISIWIMEYYIMFDELVLTCAIFRWMISLKTFAKHKYFNCSTSKHILRVFLMIKGLRYRHCGQHCFLRSEPCRR